MTHTLAPGSPLSRSLEGLVEVVRTHFEVDAALLWLRESGGEFRLRTQVGLAARDSPATCRGILDWFQAHREPLVAPELTACRVEHLGWAKAAGFASLLAVAVELEDDTTGVLALVTRRRRTFSQQDVTRTRELAGLVALAVSKVHAAEAEERRQAEDLKLQEIARVVTSAHDVKEILREVCQRTTHLCGADRATIFLWDEKVRRVFPAMTGYATGDPPEEAWKQFPGTIELPIRKAKVLAQLIETRKPVVIDDVEASDLVNRKWMKTLGVKSLLGVPLVADEEVLGALLVGTVEQVRPWSERQVELVTAVADQMAFALRKALHLQATERRLRQTEAHLKIVHALSSTLELKAQLREVTRHAARACSMDRCSISLVKDGWLVPVTSQYADGRVDHELGQAFRKLRRIRVEMLPFYPELVKRRTPIVINQPAEDPLWPPVLQVFKSTAGLFVPMIRQEQVVGMMVLGNTERNEPVTSEQVNLAMTIASQVTLAMDNARLYRDTRRRLQETEALLSITRILSSTLELKPLLREITRQAARACAMDRCSIHLREGDWVVPVMSQYADGRVNRKLARAFKEVRRVRLEEIPLLANVMDSREPVIVNNPATDPQWPPVMATFPTTAAMAVPLIRQDKVVGAMVLANGSGQDPVKPEQLTLATTIASQVALAVDNARLHEETQKRLGETRALLRVAQTLGSSLDRQDVARRSTRELTQVLGADTSIYYERDEEAGHSRGLAGYHVPERIFDSRHPRPLAEQAPFLVEALETGMPVTSTDPTNDPRFDYPVINDLAMEPRSLLYAPVISHGKHLGGLFCIWWTEVHECSDDELRLAAGIANQLALALENARQYETLKKAQERLVQSEKFRALAGMAGGVAHDFKNLLTSILGRAEVLRFEVERGRVSPEEIRANLEVIELAAQDGADTVRRLLDCTRAEPQPDAPMAVDLNQLLTDTKEVARPRWKTQALARGVQIEVAVKPGEIPAVVGSPVELREVLLNLVFNAIDAMPEGGTLTLASGAEESHVWVQVRDTGIGMSEEVQRRIFDPFFSTKGVLSNGLGLSSSYGIIHRHGGEIKVESELGRGTDFKIKLPL